MGEAIELQDAFAPENTFAQRNTALIDCPDRLSVTMSPLETTTFVATAVSPDGCTKANSLRIKVLGERRVYLSIRLHF